MLKRIAIFLAIVGLALAPFGAGAQINSGERIRDFAVTATIRSDASVAVREQIIYDFGSGSRHGIFRNVPVKYITNISVTDEAGKSYQFNVSKKGNYQEIKIGDPNTYVSGVKVYIISYTVRKAVSYFDAFDELYWNATGNEWNVPIGHASAIVVLPRDISASTLRVSCYYGPTGSNTMCNSAPTVVSGGVRTISFQAPAELGPHSGLTVAVGFPKGIIATPSFFENAFDVIADNGILLLPILVFFGMLYVWYTRGRDPKGSGTIVAEYDAPDNLTPIEISTVLRQRIDSGDISAELIELAVRGYISIKKITIDRLLFDSTDYELTKLKDIPQTEPEFDRILMEKIFAKGSTVKISELKNTFHSNLPKIYNAVYSSVVSKGYFSASPQAVRRKYVSLGVLAVVLLFILGFIGLLTGLAAVAVVLSAAVVFFFAPFMSKVTEKGARTKDAILGLKEYLQIAEKDRINFHNAPEKNPKLFEKFLPYAMILGVEKTWAKEFESMYAVPPSWYSDPGRGAFHAAILASDLSSFRTHASHVLASVPASHGGSGSGGRGFSGGGFGGGGGGSW